MNVAFAYKFEGPRTLMELGSAPRARATLGVLQSVYGRETSNFSELLQELDELLETRAWEIVPEGNPYGSFDAMLVDVIGCDLGALEQRYGRSLEKYRFDKTKPSNPHGGSRAGAGRPAMDDRPHDDINQERGHVVDLYCHNDTAEGQIARLKRDAATDEKAAELLDAVREGEMKPHAAAVAMGWRKNTPRVALPSEPDRAASRLVERFGREWCADLVIALDAAVQKEPIA